MRERGEGFYQEEEFALDALGAYGLEEGEVFTESGSEISCGGFTDCVPVMVEGFAADGVLAVGDGRALVQFFGDEVDFDAAVVCPLLDYLPDYFLPGSFGAVGGGGVEVDHSEPPTKVGADDEHVAGEDAEVGG